MEWKSLAKTFVSILFGFALGLTGSRMFPPPFHHHEPPGGPGAGFIDRFAQDMELSPGQRKQAEAIFDDERKKVDALHQEVFPRFEALREETRKRVREVLNDAQRKKFDDFNAEREAHRKEMFGREGGPPPPPDMGRPDDDRPPPHHGPGPF